MRDKDREARAERHSSEEVMKVVRGLRNGELEQLSCYLRAGGLPESPADTVALPKWVANEIARMIEHNPNYWFWLYTKARKQNEKGWTRDLKQRDRNFRIGYYVEEQTRLAGRGAGEGIIEDAKVKFSVSKATVRRAHAFVKAWLNGVQATYDERELRHPDDPLGDPMDILREDFGHQ